MAAVMTAATSGPGPGPLNVARPTRFAAFAARDAAPRQRKRRPGAAARAVALTSQFTHAVRDSPAARDGDERGGGRTRRRKVSYVSPETIAGRYGLDPALAAIGPLTDAVVTP